MRERKAKIEKELEGLSSFLAKLKSDGPREGFEPPPGYFRQFPERVMDQIESRHLPTIRSNQRRQSFGSWLELLLQPSYAIGLALLLVLSVTGAYLLLPHPTQRETRVSFSALTPEEINDYVSANLHQFGQELVLEIARDYPDMSLLPAPVEGQNAPGSYYEELFLELDEESFEEVLFF